MLIMASFVSFTSCSSDDEPDFDYPLETLYGTWEGTGIYIDGKWIDVTDYWYSKFAFSITFNSDGTYYGKGYFGTGSGTYKTSGKTIRTYVNGEPYNVYMVKSLSGTTAELSMGVEGSDETIDIRVKKK